jgi:hypothetical protein
LFNLITIITYATGDSLLTFTHFSYEVAPEKKRQQDSDHQACRERKRYPAVETGYFCFRLYDPNRDRQ